MAPKCVAYVVLASIMSLQAIAAPYPQMDPGLAAMCSDRTIPWQEKLDVCPVCNIPDIPREYTDGKCGGGAGPGAHVIAPGVWRRDAAGSELLKKDEEGSTENEAANGISDEATVEDMMINDIITHKPAPGVWKRIKVIINPGGSTIGGFKNEVETTGAVTHVQASDVSGDHPPKAGGKKRETSPASAVNDVHRREELVGASE